MKQIASAVALFAALALFFPEEGVTSGSGSVEITRDEVHVELTTPREEPTPGSEEAWERGIEAWETTNQPIAEKAVTAIQGVLPRHRALSFVKHQGLRPASVIDEEGVTTSSTTTGPWGLSVELDLLEGSSYASVARFLFTARPSKAATRAFCRDVRAAALQTVGKALAPLPVYTGYWLVPAKGSPSLLLSVAPPAQFEKAQQGARHPDQRHPYLRAAPALMLRTNAKRVVVPVEGTLVERPGSLPLAGIKVQKATRAEVARLLANPVAKAERERHADDVEFLASLVAQLAK